MDLQALADFNLVAAHGGLGRASRASGRAKATLSRRVAELEQSLGVRLIERGSQSLRRTDEGRALHERTSGPLSDIAEAGEAVVLGASTPRGRLRVSAPVLLAHVAFGRIGARFAHAYPDVQLEIVARIAWSTRSRTAMTSSSASTRQRMNVWSAAASSATNCSSWRIPIDNGRRPPRAIRMASPSMPF
ncbi:DNA-binding transcriptional LysR family regulator [Bradyrhizobium sp. USDA 4518]|nr:DNA-binding transcriptional LysR family regulator [Bradyrhizobium sp. USDA 4541]